VTAAEEWRLIVGLEDCHEISSEGRIRRTKPAQGTRVGRILATPIGRRGYRQVTIRVGERQRELYVHSLVATTFLGPRPPGQDVNHMDGDKLNNRASNLEYVSRRENLNHASKLGLLRVGEAFGRSPLKDDDILTIRKLALSMRVGVIAKMFGVSYPTVYDIVLRKTWKHVREATGSMPGVGGDDETVFTEITIKDVTPPPQ
jgi:hypothetical protein